MDNQQRPTVWNSAQCNVPAWMGGRFGGEWKWKWKSLSRVQLFATPWTVAHQAPLSMGFSRQEYWSGLPFPSPGNLSDPGNEPESPTWKADGNTIQRLSSLFKVTPLIIGGGGDQAHVILTLKAFYSLLFAGGGAPLYNCQGLQRW